MNVIITCKYEKDSIKNREKAATLLFNLNHNLLPWNHWLDLDEFELIQAFMYVLIACKYEKDQMKNSGENVMTSFSPL